MSESNEEVTEFTKRFPPSQEALDQMNKELGQAEAARQEGESRAQIRQDVLDESVLTAQQRVINGLSKTMTDYQIENMKNLAPRDKFMINNKEYTRNKMKPKMLRELREAERQYNKDMAEIDDPDLRQERDWQLLFYKANLYFGMTEQEFEETDIEYLQTVIQATELRTQGFRLYQ